ncbi:hypothetical protein AVEN_61506-1 [Araneus ventricosus]|uniref:Uncharacterized protein n=1 Tax=Araneus ventricosus TaxID=182803 RepID=A0A4Y2UTV4_ARAVE|nr:hypothetical protein AVEN_61506-1 [Araneus ventricosus]
MARIEERNKQKTKIIVGVSKWRVEEETEETGEQKEIADCQTWHNVARREERRNRKQRNQPIVNYGTTCQDRRAEEEERTKK